MDNWLPIIIVIVVVLFMIGNFSTFHKSAKRPMRKQNLSDLKETLPRTHKTDKPLETIKNKKL